MRLNELAWVAVEPGKDSWPRPLQSATKRSASLKAQEPFDSIQHAAR